MARQRCTIDAIVDAADPVTLLRSYQELAATTRDIVSTDIPRSALDDFVDLAFLVKDASIRSVVFDATLIDPAYPDYDDAPDRPGGDRPGARRGGDAGDQPARRPRSDGIEDPDAPRPRRTRPPTWATPAPTTARRPRRPSRRGKPPTRRG